MTTDQYTDFIVKWRWPIVLMTLLLLAVTAAGGKNITFSSDYKVFFDKKNEQLEAFERMQSTYTKADNVLIAVIPNNKTVFSPSTLEVIQELTERSWQLKYSTRVDSITNYQHSYSIGEDLIVEDLVEAPSSMSSEELEQAKQTALGEPLILNRLISANGQAAAVNTIVQLPQGNESAVREVMTHARQIVAEMEQLYPDIDFAITGLTPLSNAFAESAENDLMTLIPMMFLVIIIILGVLLRSISATFTVVVVIFFSILTAMGLFGWSGAILSPPTTSAPTIIMTVAVADSVHILVSFFQALRSGMNKHEAMRESIKLNLKAVTITSVTTALGFLSMNFSEVPPFRELGTIVAVGVFAALVYSTTFLPAVMMILPIKAKVNESNKANYIDAYANFLIRNKKPMFIGSVLVSIALIAAIPLNRINDEFVKYFAERTEFRQDTDLVSEKLTGIYSIAYSLGTKQDGGISDPQYIRDVDKFVQWLKQQDEVEHVYTFSDTFKRLNKNMHADDPDWYRIPDSRELAAQYLLLYEMSLPYGLDLNDQINVEKSATRVNITLKNIASVDTLALERNANIWLAANTNFAEIYEASPNLMFAHIGARNVKAVIEGALWALAGISLLLIIALRSWRLGLISLPPNLMPIGIAFGLWGIFSGNVGLSITSAIGMTMGIVVDDTVHFLAKYKVAKTEKHLSTEDAVRYAFSKVGTALLVTTFVLVSGFMVLATSTFVMNVHQGVFTAITIGVALILDFIFLPTLLLILEEKRDAKLINAH